MRNIRGTAEGIRWVPRRSRATAVQAPSDLVSIVVPARRDEPHLDACLESLRHQDHRNLQILVVGRGASDAVRRTVRRHIREDARIEISTDPDGSLATSLNLGLAAAHGRWLLRLDAAVTLPPDYISRAVAGLSTGVWGGLGGVQTAHGLTPAAQAIAAVAGMRYGEGFRGPRDQGVPQEMDSLVLGTYSVAALRGVGGWDPARRESEVDLDLDRRLRASGVRLLIDPAMSTRWYGRQSVRELFQQYRGYGQQEAVAVGPAAAPMSLRHLVAPSLLLSWCVAGALAPQRPREAAALVAPSLVALFAASAGVSRRLNRGTDRRWAALALVAMHAGWSVGAWHGTVSRWTSAARQDPGPVWPVRKGRRATLPR